MSKEVGGLKSMYRGKLKGGEGSHIQSRTRRVNYYGGVGPLANLVLSLSCNFYFTCCCILIFIEDETSSKTLEIFTLSESFLRFWSHFLKKSPIESFIFCAVS